MVQALAEEQVVGMIKESTWGTGVSPTVGIPITGGGGKPIIEEIYDEGKRGIAAKEFAAYQGSGHGEFALDGNAYPIEIGWLLAGIFGSEAISGAGDPYTHTFSLSTVVPSFTLEDTIMGGSNGGMRFTGGKVTSLGISFDSNAGVVAYTSQLMSKIPTKVTPQSLTTAPLAAWPGWRANVTAASLSGCVTKADINFTRENQIIHCGNNTQDPKYINMGPLSVEGTVESITESLVDFDNYLTDLSQTFVIAFSYGSPARSLTLTMTNANFNASPIEWDRGAVGVITKLSFKALYNATDVGPAKAVLLNSRSTVY